MRKIIVGLSVAAFALSAMATGNVAMAAKEPKKSKLGCVIGKEKWDAGASKCMPIPAPAKKTK